MKKISALLISNPAQMNEQVSNYKEGQLREQLEKFKETYRDKSSEELANILKEKKYTPAALEAARVLLEERE
jgi:hypothetical protein